MELIKRKVNYPNGKSFTNFYLTVGDETILIKGVRVTDEVNLHLLASEAEPINVTKR